MGGGEDDPSGGDGGLQVRVSELLEEGPRAAEHLYGATGPPVTSGMTGRRGDGALRIGGSRRPLQTTQGSEKGESYRRESHGRGG